MMWSASALKRHCAYPNVLGLTKVRKPSSQLAMDKGTLFHSAVELWVKTGKLPLLEDLEIQGWIDLLSMQWQPPTSTLVEIAWGLSPTGFHVHVEEPEPHVYRAMDGRQLLTAGRADVLWREGDVLRVVDWKTGSWPVAPARENLQALAGAMALAMRFEVPSYQPGIYYARDGAWDWGDVVEFQTAEAGVDFAAVQDAAQLDDKPHPGDWCAGCWDKKTCPVAAT